MRQAPGHESPRVVTAAGLALLAAFIGVGGAGPAAAQEVGATVLVRVTSAETGEPLRGAFTEVVGMRMAALTDSAGHAILLRLASGPQEIAVHHFGHRSHHQVLTLEPGQQYQLRLALEPEVLTLPAINVSVTRRMASGAALGFHRRVRTGIGNFITREEIERQQPRNFSDLLRMVPGVRLDCNSMTGACQLGGRTSAASLDMRATRTSRADYGCPVQYYIDGLYQPYENVNALRPDDIEAVEVYPRGHQAPARYSVRKNARCGVVLVWMRLTLAPTYERRP